MPPCARAHRDDLVMLDLQDNRIKYLEPKGFRGLPNLNTLLLTRNHLDQLYDNQFDGLHLLSTLVLEFNDIV